MGYRLYREIMRGAPPGWDSTMRLVALAIADEAGETTRRTIGYQVEGHWRPHGKGWRDGICEHTGLRPDGVTKALRRLAAAGYDMRIQVGEDKRGRPVYAFKGHATDYRVPPLPPRPEPQRVDHRAGIERQRVASRAAFEGQRVAHRATPPLITPIPSDLSPQENTAVAASRWPRDADDDTRFDLVEELITRLGADPLEGRIIEGMVGRGCHPREVENTIEARRQDRGPLQEIPLQAAEQRAIDHIRETAHVTREAAGEILAVLRDEAEAKGRPVGKPDRYVQAFTAEELFTRLGPEAVWNDWWWQDR